jgi:hypothetical protein
MPLGGRLHGSGGEKIYRECIPQRKRPTGTEAVHVTIIDQRVRRFGGSFYTTSGSGGISTARGATIALHRLICTQLTFPILARYLSEASVEVHDADELAETIR